MARLVTWNMRGSNWGDGAGSSPWDTLKPWFWKDPLVPDRVEVACLQECGGLPFVTHVGGPWVYDRPVPPEVRHSPRDHPASRVDRVTLTMHEWRPYRTTEPLYILYYQPPPSTYSGEDSNTTGRVNLAIVSRQPPPLPPFLPLWVIFNALPIRHLIGIQIDGVYFFTIHAAAFSRGSDAPDLLRDVQAQIASPWWVAGDYNQTPEELGVKLRDKGLLPWVTVCQPDGYTHVSQSGYSILDYAVRSPQAPNAPGGKVYPLAETGISDHSPVFYPL